MKENGSRWHPLARQRTSEQELMQWFIEFVIADMYVINFPDCGNSDNEVTDCTVSSQHFAGLRHGVERGYYLPRRPESLEDGITHQNITLMQMSVWLWARLHLASCISSLWKKKRKGEKKKKNTRPSWSVSEGHHSKSTVNTAQIWTLICIIIIIIIIIIITHTTIIIIIIM